MEQIPLTPVVLFDGYCGLCDRAVGFVMKHDRKKCFRYVALQSEAGRFLHSRYNLQSAGDSVILWYQGRFWHGSEAALRIARLLPGPWAWLWIFRMVPLSFRERVYQWIARNRHRWFGKRVDCRVPDVAERSLFPTVEELRAELSLAGILSNRPAEVSGPGSL